MKLTNGQQIYAQFHTLQLERSGTSFDYKTVLHHFSIHFDEDHVKSTFFKFAVSVVKSCFKKCMRHYDIPNTMHYLGCNNDVASTS